MNCISNMDSMNEKHVVELFVIICPKCSKHVKYNQRKGYSNPFKRHIATKSCLNLIHFRCMFIYNNGSHCKFTSNWWRTEERNNHMHLLLIPNNNNTNNNNSADAAIKNSKHYQSMNMIKELYSKQEQELEIKEIMKKVQLQHLVNVYKLNNNNNNNNNNNMKLPEQLLQLQLQQLDNEVEVIEVEEDEVVDAFSRSSSPISQTYKQLKELELARLKRNNINNEINYKTKHQSSSSNLLEKIKSLTSQVKLDYKVQFQPMSSKQKQQAQVVFQQQLDNVHEEIQTILTAKINQPNIIEEEKDLWENKSQVFRESVMASKKRHWESILSKEAQKQLDDPYYEYRRSVDEKFKLAFTLQRIARAGKEYSDEIERKKRKHQARRKLQYVYLESSSSSSEN
jgi:hypothetical protein